VAILSNTNKENYIFTAALDSSDDKNDFIIELYSLEEDNHEPSEPEKIIHNFDELISFFEELDIDEEDDEGKSGQKPLLLNII